MLDSRQLNRVAKASRLVTKGDLINTLGWIWEIVDADPTHLRTSHCANENLFHESFLGRVRLHRESSRESLDVIGQSWCSDYKSLARGSRRGRAAVHMQFTFLNERNMRLYICHKLLPLIKASWLRGWNPLINKDIPWARQRTRRALDIRPITHLSQEATVILIPHDLAT